MLGESGLYFLYCLQYLGCDGRMKLGHACDYVVASICTTQKTLHHVRLCHQVEWLNLVYIFFVIVHCLLVYMFVVFVAIIAVMGLF